jgi:hypothetical protein
MNTKNAKVLLNDLTVNSDVHNQDYWLTKRHTTLGEAIITGCAAGRAALLAGAEPKWFESYNGIALASFCEYQGERKSVQEVADEWLGIDDDESHALFIECGTEDSAVYYLTSLISAA